MQHIDWVEILHAITSRGVSQGQIAKTVGVNQSTICRLADGSVLVPRYDVGVQLLALAGSEQNIPPTPVLLAQAAINSEAVGVAHV